MAYTSTMIDDSPTKVFTTAADLTGGAFTAVSFETGGLATAGASSIPVGLLTGEYELPIPAGEEVTAQIQGGGLWLAGESIAAGDLLAAGASGVAVKATSGKCDDSYSCHVDQIIIGLDKIITLAYQRAGAASTNVAQKKFTKFDNSDTDPVAFFDACMIDIRREGRRKPNKLALGVNTFAALKNNPFIKERIKYSGTTQNPAIVNESVIAQIIGVDEVVVLDATYNDAGVGQPENMQYVCDKNGALLLYAPNTPQIDEPSAGYIFTWLLNGGDYIAIDTFDGEGGTHTEFMEAIIAYDMRKTSDALAIYFKDCVG